MMKRVLIVDDDACQRRLMCSILSEEGYVAEDRGSVSEALEYLAATPCDVVVTDMKMPDRSGLELVESVQRFETRPEIVVITAFGTIETAVCAMKSGAYDYLTKPIEHDELIMVVLRAAEKYELRINSGRLQGELIRQAHQGIIAESEGMKNVLETARKVADSEATVLLRGESGTGKERIARYIHYVSPRNGQPIQCINCAAFPDSLLESELFGYEKGAFTGAFARKTGILDAARGSTVLLDEVADMSLLLQAKILRVLQEKEIRRLGATAAIPIDVRFIAATNKNLEECVRNGTFREDLFYRLNIIPLFIPPLRTRPKDIPAMADYFLSRKGRKKTIDPGALRCLQSYPWPGNVRELESIMERVSVLSNADMITTADLPSEIRNPPAMVSSSTCALPASGIIFEEWERSMLEQALLQSKGVMTEAARLLGMTYRTFQYRAEKFGLAKEQ